MLALYLAYLDDDADKRIFEDIFYSYRKQMVKLAMSILNNKDDAEDAVSNVFLRIAQKNWDIVKEIKSDIDLRNYLLKATKNTALNLKKSKYSENISLDDDFDIKIKSGKNLSDDAFFEFISQKLEYDKVVKAICSLNEKYRYVLYYHFVLEMTVPQTARSLNQTVSATKRQLVRGKKLLINSICENKEEKGKAYEHK